MANSEFSSIQKACFSFFFHPSRNTGMKTQDEDSKMMSAGRIICYSCKMASKHAHSLNFPGQASPHVLLSLASCWQQQMKKAKGKAVSSRKMTAVCSPPSGLSELLTPPGGGSPSRDDFWEGKEAVATHFLIDCREAKCSRT